MTNRQIRRLQEVEERRRKKESGGQSRAQRRAAALQARAQEPSERKSIVARLKDYLHEVRVELRKVTWPTREQMIAFTSVTLITSLVLTIVVFGFDVGAKELILWLVELRS
ncbi:MAG TPA: preprotein translocase subunit SecE [Acidimicrobiia bacterium]|jgi:preprotein translocase subunit SecE|nr:preprotein translocase subunit SecE [Acidimicrobiia bacterium]